MADEADLEAFDEALAGLEDGLGGAREVTAAFEAELGRMRESVTLTRGQVASLSTAIGNTLRGAFEDLALEGGSLSASLRRVADGLSRAAFGAAITPVENRLGDLAASGIERAVGAAVPFAGGGAFTRGRVMPFASGGVVSRASAFAMRGGRLGVMGEAGPEAILPLARGADGRLGVRGGGGQAPVSVTINVTTPDVEGFRRSRGQVAAEVGRAIARGQRNR